MHRTILMDPPWYETGGGKIKRGADRHYPLIKTPDMPAVILGSGVWAPDDDCHLYMWATANHLPDALWLIGALGFKYKTNVVWTKEGRPGLGQYFRIQHEHLLIEARSHGPYLEMFARNKIGKTRGLINRLNDWTYWGNEAKQSEPTTS
jgi:N6-adenosine-specific RNA methylase IME4